MEIIYKIDTPDNFSVTEKNDFLKLLKKQGQVENPTLLKINSSSYLCIVYVNKESIGIGALKNVYKKPFDYAGVADLKNQFELEIGYLFVDTNPQSKRNFQGLGIGKKITQYLLKKVNSENIFATTELKDSNRMLHILKKIGFEQIGNPYLGFKTKKIISLLILNRSKLKSI